MRTLTEMRRLSALKEQRARIMGALGELRELDTKEKLAKYRNVPSQYIPASKFEDRTANGLANCVIHWFHLNGHMAWRQSSEGRYRPGEKIIDVLGHIRQMKGTWLPGLNNGQGDVAAVIAGRFIAIEIKIGTDTQSENQKLYQEQVTSAGGAYFIARTFADFLDFYRKF